MNKQELAALLEVISFFFVGLDLYGKERLGKMQTNILELSDKIYNRLTNVQNFEWNKQRSSKFMKVVYWITGFIELTFIGWETRDIWGWPKFEGIGQTIAIIVFCSVGA